MELPVPGLEKKCLGTNKKNIQSSVTTSSFGARPKSLVTRRFRLPLQGIPKASGLVLIVPAADETYKSKLNPSDVQIGYNRRQPSNLRIRFSLKSLEALALALS